MICLDMMATPPKTNHQLKRILLGGSKGPTPFSDRPKREDVERGYREPRVVSVMHTHAVFCENN